MDALSKKGLKFADTVISSKLASDLSHFATSKDGIKQIGFQMREGTMNYLFHNDVGVALLQKALPAEFHILVCYLLIGDCFLN
mmetsp:Transcript_22774/g.17200  ORF Transcript_22774/g.17200 Transcript_22774/m.17200 type:complete len:83 (+) Transcript_22774:2548-2796(+)